MTISFTTARRLPANAAVVANGINSDKLNSLPTGFNSEQLKKLALLFFECYFFLAKNVFLLYSDLFKSNHV